jgi:hypothetical protein
MGYNLKIGQAVIKWDEEQAKISCAITRLDQAPAFGEPTDYESQRWPSYSAWHNSMAALGLLDVMFSERNGGGDGFERNGNDRYPLIADHPGVAPITIEHAEAVEDALAAYKAKHPNHIAQFEPTESTGETQVCDPHLCRGTWLAFWLRWAVTNCSQPVFVNS